MDAKNRTLKTKNRVSVVVVKYNSSSMISECLKSLNNNDSSCQEIIVIDNASSDQETTRQLKGKFSDVKFIANQRNIGYGAAVNQGVRLASADYIFFMNPDMVVPEGTIEKLISFMESHVDCGACSPYIQTPEKPWWYRWLFLSMPIDIARGRIEKRGSCYKVKFPLGCAVLVKRDFFLKELDGFDERFFLYYEDNDFGKRIRDCGKFNYIVLSAPIIHFHAKSSATIPKKELGKILAKSRWYFAKKHNLLALKIWCLIYSPIQRFFCWLVNRP